MLMGTLCLGCGIAMAKHSALGTSPISSWPAVSTDIAQAFGAPWLTMGMFTFAINTICLVIEIALLRKRFHPSQLLQIPLFFLLAAAIDLCTPFVNNIPLPNYAAQMACQLASIAIVSFGINLQLYADILMTPADALVRVIAHVAHKPYPTCKVAFDTTLMITAGIASLIVLGGLYGVREGSIISALCMGNAIRVWGSLLSPITRKLPNPTDARRTIIKPLIPAE